MKMKLAKTLIFLVAWTLSFACGIYLVSVIFMGNTLSGFDIVLNGCGFVLSMLWLWFNCIKV